MKTAPSRRSAKRKRFGRSVNSGVLNVYMEEPPLVSDWRKLTESPNVVVVPFFISDGLHGYEDIPVLLGIAGAAGVDRGRQDQRPRLQHMAKSSARILTPSTVANCSMHHLSAPIPVLPTSSSSRRTRLEKLEIVLALGFLCARLLSRE